MIKSPTKMGITSMITTYSIKRIFAVILLLAIMWALAPTALAQTETPTPVNMFHKCDVSDLAPLGGIIDVFNSPSRMHFTDPESAVDVLSKIEAFEIQPLSERLGGDIPAGTMPVASVFIFFDNNGDGEFQKGEDVRYMAIAVNPNTDDLYFLIWETPPGEDNIMPDCGAYRFTPESDFELPETSTEI